MTQPSNDNLAVNAIAARQSPSFKKLAIILSLCFLALPLVTVIATCGKSEGAARRQLDQKGIQFSEETFLDRVKRGDVETVKLFLAAGISPDAKDQNGDTALVVALTANAGPVAEALIAGGADVNARTRNNSTALHLVALTGDIRIGQLLLEHNADVNAKTDIGETPLMIAALRDNAELVRMLLKSGADINARDSHGETPLMHAVERNHSEIIRMLKDAGAKQ